MIFTYQHTCKKGQQEYILSSTPFKSVKKKKEKDKYDLPFLGEGHYLWEENIEAAKRWGIKHYNNNYNVVEFTDLEIPEEEILDFLNRRHLQYFNELRKLYIEKLPERKKWRLGVWIEFLKSLNKETPGLFPFNYFRADENLPDVQENEKIKERINFVDGLYYYTYLSPLHIICVIDKKSLKLKNKSIVV